MAAVSDTTLFLTTDAATEKRIEETRKYVQELKLGAYIDGHWIGPNVDPCHLQAPLLQLLQHPFQISQQQPQSGSSSSSFPGDLSHGESLQSRAGQQPPVPLTALAVSTFQVRDPATGEMICELPALETPYTRAAVAAATRAQHSSWSLEQAPALKRHALLLEWERLVTAERELIARVLSLESGKALLDARAEVAYAASFIKWFAEQLRRDNGLLIPSTTQAHSLMAALRCPVGVCALITPWNFPAAMLTRKAAAALAAGCCCVCKPPAETPLTALLLAKLAERAGFPPGVLNIVTTDHRGARLFGEDVCRLPQVRKLSFTGSTRVGKLLMQQAASTLKRVSLELGGNAPFIVFEDADVEQAAAAIVASKFRGGGQTCVSANRIYVHCKIWDELLAALLRRVVKLSVGHGLREDVAIGCLINENACEKCARLVAQSIRLGGKPLYPQGLEISAAATGGEACEAKEVLQQLQQNFPEDLKHKDGSSFFFPPVILDCRAFDGMERESMRWIFRKEAAAADRLQRRDSLTTPQQQSRPSQSYPIRAATFAQPSQQPGHTHELHQDLAQQQHHSAHGGEECCEILQTEIFGPILPLYSFREEEDVIRRANCTKAGLAAYFCTRDLYRLHRVSNALEAGMVAVNTGIFSTAEAPFGGVKESGLGREGSVYGLDEFVQIKYIALGCEGEKRKCG